EAAADALRQRHDVGGDARPLIRKELAGATDTGLHLVDDKEELVLVAKRAEVAHELTRGQADAALALDRFDDDRRGLRPDRLPDRLHVAMRHLHEAAGNRTHALDVFRVAGGRERGERAAMEGAGKGDEMGALGTAVDEVITARGLDRALDGLGAGIA